MKGKKEVAAIILAAGSSSRLGQSKQLLSIEGEPLITRTIKEVLGSDVNKAVVVLGANADVHKQAIAHLDCEIVINTDWSGGMGTSIAMGVRHLLKTDPNLHAVIFCVCDQPLMTRALLNKILEKYAEGRHSIVASFYEGSEGVPALFAREHFEELLTIDQQAGAKQVLRKNASILSRVDFPEGAFDIDTPEDYERFMQP
jgi:molybdenum cofactor cytidylyltransferase